MRFQNVQLCTVIKAPTIQSFLLAGMGLRMACCVPLSSSLTHWLMFLTPLVLMSWKVLCRLTQWLAGSGLWKYGTCSQLNLSGEALSQVLRRPCFPCQHPVPCSSLRKTAASLSCLVANTSTVSQNWQFTQVASTGPPYSGSPLGHSLKQTPAESHTEPM